MVVVGSLVAKSCPTLATPWTVACQGPLSMGFSRQEYWSGLLFPSPEDLPDPGIEPRSPALQANSLPTELWGKPWCEMLGWMKPKLESRLPGKISVISDMQMTPPLWQKAKRNWRASWWKWKSKVKKLAYSSIFRELRSWHPVPSLHGK